MPPSCPLRAASSVTIVSSSLVWSESSLSGSGIRNRRMSAKAIEFNTATIGRNNALNVRMIGLSRTLTVSGDCSASAFGIISPNTTCM